jgi:hypothetical protein
MFHIQLSELQHKFSPHCTSSNINIKIKAHHKPQRPPILSGGGGGAMQVETIFDLVLSVHEIHSSSDVIVSVMRFRRFSS